MDIGNAAQIAYGFVPGQEAVELEQWHGQQDGEARRYEEETMEEARRIVAGQSEQLPTREHLRVALAWLDGHEPQPAAPSFSGPGNPF